MRRHLLALGCFILMTSMAAAQEKAKLPDGAALRIGKHRLRVGGAIADYAFTPDHRTLIVAYDEKDPRQPNIVLFDVATGLERTRLAVRGAKHIAMARHKPMMAVDSYDGVELWDVAAEKRLRQWDFPECVDEASAVAIAPDGAQVVAATPTLLRWNANTGEVLPSFRPRSSEFPVQALQFSMDGSKLVTTESHPRSDRSRRYFGFGGAEESLVFEVANWYLSPISGMVGPRTRLLHTTLWSIGSQFVFRPHVPMTVVWDAKTGTKLFEIGNDIGGDAVVSPDASLVALSGRNNFTYNRRVDLIRLERGWPHVGSLDGAGMIVFSPDSKQIVVDGNYLWDIAARKKVREIDALDASSMRFSYDGKLLAAVTGDEMQGDRYGERYGIRTHKYYSSLAYPSPMSESNVLQLLDVSTGKPKSYEDGYAGAVGGLTYSPDGRWLASFSREMLFLHDAKTGAEVRRWTTHKGRITQIVFAPDGKTLASASYDTTIALWDPATGKERRRLTYANRPETALAFSPDGKILISITDDGAMRRWNVAEGKFLDSTQPLAMVSPAVAKSGDYVGYLDVNRETGSIRLQWLRTRTGKTLAQPDPHLLFAQHSGSESLAFSANGKLLAASGYVVTGENNPAHAVRVWESATQREVVRFPSEQIPTRLLAISPDGRMLAQGSALPGKKREAFELLPLPFDKVDRNDQPLSEYAIMLRDLASAQENRKDDDKTLRPITGHLSRITCLAFSPDGKFLATGGVDQVVYIWRVEHFFKPATEPLFKGEVAELWSHLADGDPGKAYRAIAQLERQPKETVALLRKHLPPAAVAEAKVIDKHLRDLASGNFAVRSQANTALEKLGDQATAQLQVALKTPANLEVKRRLETLIEKLDRPFELPDNIRAYRALALLERIGTPEAQQLLEELSRGAPSAWLSAEARESLRRVP